jgi:hypothetical protein
MLREATYLQASSAMSTWMNALDRRPGVRPEITLIGDTMVFVLPIAADATGKAGVQLVLRSYGDDVLSAAIEPDARRRRIP